MMFKYEIESSFRAEKILQSALKLDWRIGFGSNVCYGGIKVLSIALSLQMHSYFQ